MELKQLLYECGHKKLPTQWQEIHMLLFALCETIDKRGGRGIGNGTYRRVSLFSHTGVPLVNLLFETITWLKFLKIPKWFRNATAWSRTPKTILIKHGCHMPPYQAKITYIPIVKFGIPLVSVQLEFSTI